MEKPLLPPTSTRPFLAFNVRVGTQKKYQLHTRCDIWKGTWQEAVLKAWKCAMESLKETKKSQTRSWVPTFSEGTLMKNKLWRSLLFTWLPMVRYPLTMQFSFNFILFYPRLVHACLLIRSSPRKAGKRNMYCFTFLNKRWLILESFLPFLVEVVILEAEICQSSPFRGYLQAFRARGDSWRQPAPNLVLVSRNGKVDHVLQSRRKVTRGFTAVFLGKRSTWRIIILSKQNDNGSLRGL